MLHVPENWSSPLTELSLPWLCKKQLILLKWPWMLELLFSELSWLNFTTRVENFQKYINSQIGNLGPGE